jgi:hypothetical protein
MNHNPQNQTGEALTAAAQESIDRSLKEIKQYYDLVVADRERGLALVKDEDDQYFLLAAQRTQHGMAWQCYAEFEGGMEQEALTAYNTFIRKTQGVAVAMKMIELGLPPKQNAPSKKQGAGKRQAPEGNKVIPMGPK